MCKHHYILLLTVTCLHNKAAVVTKRLLISHLSASDLYIINDKRKHHGAVD